MDPDHRNLYTLGLAIGTRTCMSLHNLSRTLESMKAGKKSIANPTKDTSLQ